MITDLMDSKHKPAPRQICNHVSQDGSKRAHVPPVACNTTTRDQGTARFGRLAAGKAVRSLDMARQPCSRTPQEKLGHVFRPPRPCSCLRIKEGVPRCSAHAPWLLNTSNFVQMAKAGGWTRIFPAMIRAFVRHQQSQDHPTATGTDRCGFHR